MSGLPGPSRFWENLAAEHSSLLTEHGPEKVKRQQALKYFARQWDLQRLRTSEQFRFLLQTSLVDLVASAFEPNPLSSAAWDGTRWYLTQIFPNRSMSFLHPNELNLFDDPADVVISISNLQEMTAEQLTEYLNWFDLIMDQGLVDLKQWDEWHNPVAGITSRFRDWPIPPSRWELLIDVSAPVQTSFRERCWRVSLIQGIF